ncbi:MAG: adenosylmethionine--8-amino-7-oxononanoate transaminase [Firmicutes bacterium]|nr:adenosylmethionine--8-amino-7-oxononanoate transaminase [Bacillota bacterium]
MNELQRKDLEHIWHPCSQMKDYEDLAPIVIKKGYGVFLEDINGSTYLDGISSWWVNLFGHSNKRINKALYNQSENLEHVIFANFSSEPAIKLAEKIANITPSGLNKVFFSDNGSSANEIALKISYQYHKQSKKTKKKKYVSLKGAYHGGTIGALSVGGFDLYKDTFKPILLDSFNVDGPDCYRCKYDKSRDTCNAECFESMEKTVSKNHEEITAIILEPMLQGAAGMRIYSPNYLKKVRNLCDKYDINLIADEVAVGFGRTGKMFACEHANISPDIMTLGKGITAGYLPIALTVVTDKIYSAFYDDYTKLKGFLHSHSYSGNPLGCRVALESLNIFKDEDIINKINNKAKLLRKKVLNSLSDIPNVGEYRQIGMIGAIELVEDKENKKGFDWKKRVGYEIYKIALKKGVLLRPLGNVIYFMPPYIINEKEMDFMVTKAKESIKEYFNNN